MVQFKLCNICKKYLPSAALPHHLTYCGVIQYTVEQVPVEQVPVEQVPVEQVPVEQVPVEQVPVEVPTE